LDQDFLSGLRRTSQNSTAFSLVKLTSTSCRHSPAQPPEPYRAEATQESDIFAKIERLADLQQKGILSSEEFAAKKAELLSRL
jgi:hypothetical protein